MRGWIKGSLLVLSVFGTSWTGAVSYWRATNRMPSTVDLLAWLAALPLLLLLAVWLVRRAAAARAAPAAGAPGAQAAAAEAAPAPPAALASLAIVGTAVHTPHGASPAELADAIAAQRARAGLDPELMDEAGFPVLSSRSDAAGDDGLRDEVASWRKEAAIDDPRWTPEQWRALALGTDVAAQLLVQAASHPHAAPADEGGDAAVRLPMLGIHAAVMPDWTEQQCSTAAAWLARLASQAGWPAERVQASVLPTPASNSLTRLAVKAQSGGEPVLAIVLAFGSQLGEASVERLSMQGTLFNADNQQGLIPGEAAAGLLVADAAQAALFGVPAPVLQLAALPLDGKAHGAAGRKTDPALLRGLAANLVRSEDEAKAVTALFADTGHRTACVMELMRFAGEALPQLDPGQDVRATGGACGSCGEAPFLAALALAHQHALDTGASALCVGIEDPRQRIAALVRPAAAQS